MLQARLRCARSLLLERLGVRSARPFVQEDGRFTRVFIHLGWEDSNYGLVLGLVSGVRSIPHVLPQ